MIKIMKIFDGDQNISNDRRIALQIKSDGTRLFLFKKLLLLLFIHVIGFARAQTPADSSGIPEDEAMADDPSRFFTRVEFFNELQKHSNNFYLNQTTVRTIVKLGDKFTTRLDIPFLYNSVNTAEAVPSFGIRIH
jgi:hypothetical protein